MGTLYGCVRRTVLWDNRRMAPQTRQSERSRQTDMKVAGSAANAVRRDGVDQLALTRVASDAGYSSGVIYARCDDRSELMVLAWEKSFWPALSPVIDDALTAMTARDITALDSSLARWGELCAEDAVPDIGSAVEVIAAARRDEVIAEVVHHDINALLERHGAGPGTGGAQRELMVLTTAMLLGTPLLNSALPAGSDVAIDPVFLLHLFARRDAELTPVTQEAPAGNGFVRPRTGDEVRDALIDATEYVTARSGVHRATVSRIARRAGVSVGAIYGLYDNKETLVLDCVSVLHPPQAARDIAAFADLTAERFRSVIGANLRTFLSPERSLWRLFRIECLVAARHSPPLAAMLEDFGHDHLDSIGATLNLSHMERVPARGMIVGLAVLATVDPTLRDIAWEWFPVG